jgi:N-acyl-D-aspartate/D-glutamate deacylase
MTLDTKIINGWIVDGTGAPGYAGSIGIRNGVIVAVGEVTEPAIRVIDAQSCVIAPGFVDIHTHYDAQIFWDPFLSISPWKWFISFFFKYVSSRKIIE